MDMCPIRRRFIGTSTSWRRATCCAGDGVNGVRRLAGTGIPCSRLLLRAANLKKGASTTGREVVGSVTMDQCREIAELKMKDLNAYDVEAGARMIAGSAVSMGLEVKG